MLNNLMACNDLILHELIHGGTCNLLKYLINAKNMLHLNCFNENILHALTKRKVDDIPREVVPLNFIPLDVFDINAQDVHGDTPLHLACRFGKFELIKLFLKHENCLFNLQNKHGDLPLHDLCRTYIDSQEIIDIIPIDLIDINTQNIDGDTPLHLACRNGNKKLVQLLKCNNCLFTLKNNNGDLPLHKVCELKDVWLQYNQKNEITNDDAILQANEKNDSLDDGDAFLQILQYNERKKYDSSDFSVITNDDDAILQTLPITCVDVCTFNEKGLAPIHIACKNCHLKTIKYLHQKCETCLSLPHLSHKTAPKLPIEFIFDFHYQFFHVNNPLLKVPEVIHYLVRHTPSSPFISNDLKLFIDHLSCNVHFKETEKHLTEEDPLFSFTCSMDYPFFKEMNSFKFLCRAAWYGRIDIMKYLIYEEKCDPRDVDNRGNDALSYACHLLEYCSMPDPQFFPVKSEFSLPAVKFLVDQGCLSIESRYPERRDIFTKVCYEENNSLFTAIVSDSIELKKTAFEKVFRLFEKLSSNFVIEALKFLVKSFESNQIVNFRGETPIHLTCYHDGLVDVLKDHELTPDDLHATNVNGHTPLDIACIHGNMCIIKHLFENNHVSAEELTLSVALNYRHSHLVAYLLENTPLIDILKQRDKLPCSFLKQVVSKGYKFDINTANYNTILDNQGNSMLHLACQFDAVRTVRYLKKNTTFHTLSRNSEEDTPLHIACKNLAFKSLKELGSSAIHKKNHLGNTPLHIACQNTSIALVRYLNHCDLSVQNDDGDTPVHIACRKGCFSIVYYLQKHHQHMQKALSLSNIAKELPLGIALRNFSHWKITLLRLKSLYHLISLSMKEEVIEYEAASLLSFLCQREEHYYVEIVQQLVNYGVRLDIRDDKEKLPLHYAAATSLDMLKLCVSPEINVDSKDKAGNTPLHIACVHEKQDIVKFLLEEMECDCNMENAEGKTPLHVACINNNIQNICILLPHVKKFCPDKYGNYSLHLLCETFTDENFCLFAKLLRS